MSMGGLSVVVTASLRCERPWGYPYIQKCFAGYATVEDLAVVVRCVMRSSVVTRDPSLQTLCGKSITNAKGNAKRNCSEGSCVVLAYRFYLAARVSILCRYLVRSVC
jgi:hypothetical protein